MSVYYPRTSSSTSSDQTPQSMHSKLAMLRTAANVPRAVHTLLNSTKRLQDVLKLWSMEKATEDDVSDLYVQIGHEFNATLAAFAYHNIELSDLHEFPNDLRTVLEQCLSVDPSPEALQTYLSDVRSVIYRLLKGLLERQAQWEAATRRFDGAQQSSDSL